MSLHFDLPCGLGGPCYSSGPVLRSGGFADKVKNLWDEGLKYTEIARRVGYNRNLVAEALAFWFTSRGQTPPDGRHFTGRLKRELRLAEKIADRVMAMVQNDLPIAVTLGTSRNRVTEAIRIWHKKRDC